LELRIEGQPNQKKKDAHALQRYGIRFFFVCIPKEKIKKRRDRNGTKKQKPWEWYSHRPGGFENRQNDAETRGSLHKRAEAKAWEEQRSWYKFKWSIRIDAVWGGGIGVPQAGSPEKLGDTQKEGNERWSGVQNGV